MRYVALLLIGLFIGALGAVAAVSALRQGTSYHAAVMTVLKHQMGAIHGMREKNQCAADDIAHRLQVLESVSAEVNDAFLPVGDDERFKALSADLHNAVIKAQAANATDCDTLADAMAGVGGTCKACHDAFR